MELTKILRFELRPDDVTKPHSDRRHHCPGSDGYQIITLPFGKPHDREI